MSIFVIGNVVIDNFKIGHVQEVKNELRNTRKNIEEKMKVGFPKNVIDQLNYLLVIYTLQDLLDYAWDYNTKLFNIIDWINHLSSESSADIPTDNNDAEQSQREEARRRLREDAIQRLRKNHELLKIKLKELRIPARLLMTIGSDIETNIISNLTQFINLNDSILNDQATDSTQNAQNSGEAAADYGLISNSLNNTYIEQLIGGIQIPLPILNSRISREQIDSWIKWTKRIQLNFTITCLETLKSSTSSIIIRTLKERLDPKNLPSETNDDTQKVHKDLEQLLIKLEDLTSKTYLYFQDVENEFDVNISGGAFFVQKVIQSATQNLNIVPEIHSYHPQEPLELISERCYRNIIRIEKDNDIIFRHSSEDPLISSPYITIYENSIVYPHDFPIFNAINDFVVIDDFDGYNYYEHPWRHFLDNSDQTFNPREYPQIFVKINTLIEKDKEGYKGHIE